MMKTHIYGGGGVEYESGSPIYIRDGEHLYYGRSKFGDTSRAVCTIQGDTVYLGLMESPVPLCTVRGSDVYAGHAGGPILCRIEGCKAYDAYGGGAPILTASNPDVMALAAAAALTRGNNALRPTDDHRIGNSCYSVDGEAERRVLGLSVDNGGSDRNSGGSYGQAEYDAQCGLTPPQFDTSDPYRCGVERLALYDMGVIKDDTPCLPSCTPEERERLRLGAEEYDRRMSVSGSEYRVSLIDTPIYAAFAIVTFAYGKSDGTGSSLAWCAFILCAALCVLAMNNEGVDKKIIIDSVVDRYEVFLPPFIYSLLIWLLGSAILYAGLHYVGYVKLMILALVAHVLSGVILFFRCDFVYRWLVTVDPSSNKKAVFSVRRREV